MPEFPQVDPQYMNGLGGIVAKLSKLLQALPRDQISQDPQGAVGQTLQPQLPSGKWDILLQAGVPLLGMGVGKALETARGIQVPHDFLPSLQAPEAAVQSPPLPIHEIINARDSLYHATDPDGALGILRDGSINASGQTSANGVKIGEGGVSVSRVPRVSSKGDKAVSLVLDPRKMPVMQPITEIGYRKSIDDYTPAHGINPSVWNQDSQGSIFNGTPNKTYEFENRTQGTPVSTSAVKGIVVDRKALINHVFHDPGRAVNTLQNAAQEEEDAWNKARKGIPVSQEYADTLDALQRLRENPSDEVSSRLVDAHIALLKQRATEAGIPFRVAQDGRQLHSYRAAFSKMRPQDMWGMALGALGLGASMPQKDSQ